MGKPTNELWILLLGDPDPLGVQPTLAEEVQADLARAVKRATCRERVKIFAGDDFCDGDIDLIVVSQCHFGQRPPGFYRQWQRRFPLARWVTVWGAWCSGGIRTGYPNNLSTYVSRLAWPWHSELFLRQYFGRQVTLWDPPATRSPAERLGLAARLSKDHESARGGSIHLIPSRSGIGTAWQDVASTLQWNLTTYSDVARALAAGPVGDPAALWVWEVDGPQLAPPQYGQFRRQLGGQCLVVLGMAEPLQEHFAQHDSPTTETLQSRWGCGDTLLLTKPFLLPELQAAIGDLRLQNGGRSNGLQSLHNIDH
jgi:hypothetical protein